MDIEFKLRMALELIQKSKECLSPMNNENSTLWAITCDLEKSRKNIETVLKTYSSCDTINENN